MRVSVLLLLCWGACLSEAADDALALATIDDIRKRVAVAGGATEGFLVFSLAWASNDDLDLHVKLPGGKSIYANNPRAENRRGKVLGELDVDMCLTRSKCTARPVENVVFPRTVPMGTYSVLVRNYAYRNPLKRPVKFDLMVRFGKIGSGEVKHKLFQGLCTVLEGPESDVLVYEFILSKKNGAPH